MSYGPDTYEDGQDSWYTPVGRRSKRVSLNMCDRAGCHHSAQFMFGDGTKTALCMTHMLEHLISEKEKDGH